MYRNDEEHESDLDDYENETFGPSFKPSYVVIAIDTHPSMFIKNENGEIPFRSCLESCYNLADSLILHQDKRSWSPFAVIFTGSAKPLIDFDTNVLESVKILKEKSLLADSQLKDEFQRKVNIDLGEFLLTCKKVFHQVKSVFYKRTLIYISNDDRPIADKNSKFTALNEIKTYSANQIEFQIVPTIRNFNYKLFYNELYSILGAQKQEEICTDTEGLTQKLSSSVLVKINERKVVFYPFKGDLGRFLRCYRVRLFSNVQLANNTYMTLTGEKVVRTVVPGEETPYFKIKYASANSDKSTIVFDAAEKDSFQDYDTPKGLTLLAVADRQIGVGHVFTKPALIKADFNEELPFFRKFWDTCVATKKVLICLSKVRQPDKIRYVELIPVLVDGYQMFLEKCLPYGNEVVWPFKQKYPEEEENEERKKVVSELVDTLTFDFNINMIPDEAFLKKKAYIKSKLLDVPIEEVGETGFNQQQSDEALEEVVTKIREKFDLVVEVKKRKAESFSPRVKRGRNNF